MQNYPIRGAALVTGGSARLGRAMVLELAAMGHDVVVHYAGSQKRPRPPPQMPANWALRPLWLKRIYWIVMRWPSWCLRRLTQSVALWAS